MVYYGAETIRKYEKAAENRYSEATFLLENQRRLAGVYLLGYAIEMWISAAYFRLRGYSPARVIDLDARYQAEARAVRYGFEIKWQHDLTGWARLLVEERSRIAAPATIPSGVAPFDVSFAQAIVSHSHQAYQVWRPALRYSPFDPDQSDTDEVRNAAQWFKDHYDKM
jgi:hypothetical protein